MAKPAFSDAEPARLSTASKPSLSRRELRLPAAALFSTQERYGFLHDAQVKQPARGGLWEPADVMVPER
jgi:hypothetical protein